MKTLVITLTLLLVSACATNYPKSSATSHVKEEAVIIYGQGGGVSGFLKSILLPIGVQKDIELLRADGGTIDNKGESTKREYWIKEGEHSLYIRCSLKIGGFLLQGGTEISVSLVAGGKYILDAKLGKRAGPYSFSSERTVCIPFVIQLES